MACYKGSGQPKLAVEYDMSLVASLNQYHMNVLYCSCYVHIYKLSTYVAMTKYIKLNVNKTAYNINFFRTSLADRYTRFVVLSLDRSNVQYFWGCSFLSAHPKRTLYWFFFFIVYWNIPTHTIYSGPGTLEPESSDIRYIYTCMQE